MNNQHLLVDDFAEMKKWNPAVQYSIGQNDFIGIARFVTTSSSGSIVKEVMIDFEWTMRVWSIGNLLIPLKKSLRQFAFMTFEEPLLITSGDPLILACKENVHVTMTHSLSKTFAFRKILADHERNNHHP